MTYATLKTRLFKQLVLYIHFLPYCDNETQLFKLLAEIQFLKLKIEKINRMTMSEAHEVVPVTTEAILSKIQ